MLARIKSKLSYLTTTSDEVLDLSEVHLLEWSNMNQARLAQTIQEISSHLLHGRRSVQVALSVALRQAIWNWINVHPSEYESMVENERKLDSNVDNVFDILASLSDFGSSASAQRSKSFYNLMAMLLVLSPDTTKRVIMGDKATGTSKKITYLETCRKGAAGTKAFEAAAASYIDLLRAAMAVSPKYESSGVRSMVSEILNDLIVRFCYI